MPSYVCQCGGIFEGISGICDSCRGISGCQCVRLGYTCNHCKQEEMAETTQEQSKVLLCAYCDKPIERMTSGVYYHQLAKDYVNCPGTAARLKGEAGVAQFEEHLSRNQEVAGSPAPSSNIVCNKCKYPIRKYPSSPSGCLHAPEYFSRSCKGMPVPAPFLGPVCSECRNPIAPTPNGVTGWKHVDPVDCLHFPIPLVNDKKQEATSTDLCGTGLTTEQLAKLNLVVTRRLSFEEAKSALKTELDKSAKLVVDYNKEKQHLDNEIEKAKTKLSRANMILLYAEEELKMSIRSEVITDLPEVKEPELETPPEIEPEDIGRTE